jgi:hypothetical protein
MITQRLFPTLAKDTPNLIDLVYRYQNIKKTGIE